MNFYNRSSKLIIIDGYKFPSRKYVKIDIEKEVYEKVLCNRNIWTSNLVNERIERMEANKTMMVTVLNTAHFKIEVGNFIFNPFEISEIKIGRNESIFKQIRSERMLRVDRINNDEYIKKHNLVDGNKFNFIYDIQSQHAGKAYEFAIEALANPIMKHLGADASYSNRPLKKINCRFFSSLRINEQNKILVGPNDVFFSHGIADKNYWIGDHIKDYKYAFVPGPAWEKRMRETGYKGEIFICGYTKLDPLLNGEYLKNEYKKPYIVWAPTHGYHMKNKGRSTYPQCLNLVNEIDKKYQTKIALHPTSKMHTKEKHTPTLQELVDADVVIADAGSTLYEAWILDKPVIFPDWICKNDTMNHFKHDKNNFEYRIYNEEIGYHAKDMKELNKMIEIALVDGMKEEEKEFIETIYPKKLRGKAGKTAAGQLRKIAEVLSNV